MSDIRFERTLQPIVDRLAQASGSTPETLNSVVGLLSLSRPDDTSIHEGLAPFGVQMDVEQSLIRVTAFEFLSRSQPGSRPSMAHRCAL